MNSRQQTQNSGETSPNPCRHPDSEVVMYDLKKDQAYIICHNCNQYFTRQMTSEEFTKEREKESRGNKRLELQNLN